MVQRRSPLALAPLLGLILSITNTFLLTHAQSFSPVITWGSISDFVEGKALYIQGGVVGTQYTTPQSYAIDLSTAWDVSSPAYKMLPNGVNDYYFPAALLNDNSTWYMISNGTHYYYNLPTGDLTPLPTFNDVNGVNGTDSGFKGVTDPRTGIVYVPNGYYSKQDRITSLLKFSPGSTTSTPGTMPAALSSITLYAISWSDFLKTFLVYGGQTWGTLDQMTNVLMRYNIADGSWTSVVTTGQAPPRIGGACMVQAYGGTKMVLFGGDTSDQVAQQSIYILDVATWVWTKGADAGAENARGGAACAVTKDMFVAQGGWTTDPNFGVTKNPTIVYNLKTGAWVSRFDPASSVPSPSVPSHSVPSPSVPSPSPPGLNVGAIIGGVLAGVVVICGLAFWGYRSRKVKNAIKHNQPENNQHKPLTPPSPVGPGSIQPMAVPMCQQSANAAPNMQAVFAHQYQQVSQQSPHLSPVPAPVPVNDYYQLPQPPAYQIPIVSRPEAYQQLQQHQSSQFEQQQQQLGLEYRIKDSQLQQERALAHQIEAEMAQLQMMKDQRAASEAGSPNAQQHYGSPQSPISDVPTHDKDGNDGSYVRPVSTFFPVDVTKPTQTSPSHRANPQYIPPMVSEYVDEFSSSRDPQLQG